MPAQELSAEEYGPGPRIVAGVDGSDSSLSALRWAIRQARLTGAAVDAVAAWHYPTAGGGFGYVPMGTGENLDFQEITKKVLADAIGRAVEAGTLRRAGTSACAPTSSRATPLRCWSTPRPAPTCSCWAVAGMADSPKRCSARSASTACITRTAPS